MDWPHSCFYFQEVNLFQRADKESGCGWKFPLLHHWPKWKQSAHSRWTLWFPLPIPQTCQVWGHIVHLLFTLQICSLLAIGMRKHITILSTCSCQFCMMFDCLLYSEFFCEGKSWSVWTSNTWLSYTFIEAVKAGWIQICCAILTKYLRHIHFFLLTNWCVE